MKRLTYRHMFVVLAFLLYTPYYADKANGVVLSSSSELNKPLNYRINNEISEFEYTPYIDKQVERFMSRSAIKGVSIAVVKNEKLVFNRAYGYADEENVITCSPENLFRIASVSKLITAVAVMKLVEEGKLSLDDQVFGKDGFFKEEAYLDIKDKNLLKIKILHLLNHTSGWTQRYGDPMFNPLSIAKKMGDEPKATLDTYLRYVISRKLYYKPGTAYGYSNMAYVFLGAIIEKATGMAYEDYIRFNILYPNGIYDMHLGKNLFKDKLPNEVRYYEQDGSIEVYACNGDSTLVPKAYGGNDIELLGAAGGWIASAPELAKFITLIDGFDSIPDILTKESLSAMTGELGNPLGWIETVGGNWTRTGSFAGTAAVIHRNQDGTEWVFLSNTSNWQGPAFSNDIKRLMQRIDSRVKYWPDKDLFLYYNPEALSYESNIDNDQTNQFVVPY